MPYSDPKFPVVNADPDVDDCLKSMRWSDVFQVGGIMAGSWCYGYVTGKPVRAGTASTAVAIGLTFATFVVIQNTRGRLMGYQENAREVKKYGAAVASKPMAVAPSGGGGGDVRFPVATGLSTTKAPLNWGNYN